MVNGVKNTTQDKAETLFSDEVAKNGTDRSFELYMYRQEVVRLTILQASEVHSSLRAAYREHKNDLQGSYKQARITAAPP